VQTLWLYGVIDAQGFGDISAIYVRDELERANRNQRLLVRINSPGGSVFEAVSIHTQLSQWPGGVDVQIDGLAASAASYIATVGQTVSIARDAMLMIHNAWGATVGDAREHQESAKRLELVTDSIVNAYVAKSGKSRATVKAAMDAETWFTAAGAVDFGLADVILGADGTPQSASGRTIAAMQAELNAFRATVGV
jgi:ATP-dependent protease ClpP protease subunit